MWSSLFPCALGPLHRDDILALAESSLELNSWTLEEALEPLRRFVVGDGINNGYVYGHPRLGIHFRERLSSSERCEVDAHILAWCNDQVASAQDSNTALSSYVVHYFGAHLERADAELPRYKPLLSDVWRNAWFAHEGSHSSYKADLLRIRKALQRSLQNTRSTENRLELIVMGMRCAMCLASVNQVAANTPAEFVVPLVEKAVWPRHGALAYARAIENPTCRARALICLRNVHKINQIT